MRRVLKRRHRVRQGYKPLLTRPECMSIMAYCEHMFESEFRRRARMLHSKPEDVCSDVKVYVWQSIIKYRDKPYLQVLKLGFVTAKNRLTSVSRDNLTRPFKPVNIEPFLPFLRAGSNDPAKQVEFLELMHRIAYKLVGSERAGSLLRALKYDWSLRNRRLITRNHRILCNKLGMTPHEIYNNVMAIRKAMRENYSTKVEVITIKQDGKWVQRYPDS